MPLPPVSEFLRSTLGFRPLRRRAGSSRPTNVMVHGKRAGQETRPYGMVGKTFCGRDLAGGHRGPPLRRFWQITAEPDNGRGEPRPYGIVGKTFCGGDLAGGHRGPPLRRFWQITAEPDNGRGLPRPYGIVGETFRGGEQEGGCPPFQTHIFSYRTATKKPSGTALQLLQTVFSFLK